VAVVTVHAAKTNLAKLIEKAEAGEEVIIARGKRPVARFVPIAEPKPKRRFGAMRGKVWVGPEFFEPLPEDELKLWE
jgi:prevent-host-death family protein